MAAYGVMNYVAMAGFILSALSYLAHMFVGFESVYFVIGMTMLVCGYSALFTSKLIAVIKEKKAAEDKKTDAPTPDAYGGDEGKNPKTSFESKTVLQYFGYALLTTFFVLIFVKPEFTLHIRFYDVFAAVGYFLMMLTKYVPLALAVFPVLLYYIFGGAYKITEEGWINKLQLVARSLLALYYGATWIGSLHLF